MAGSLSDLFATDPQQALKLLRKMQAHVVVPHAGQKEVVDHPARFKVLNCGRRWGKTKIGVKLMVAEALKPAPEGKKERLCWWVAPTYRVVKRGYAETLRQLPRELLTHDPPPETNFDAGRSVTLRLKNGNKIEFYSAERPGGMLGEGVDYAVVDEAATIPSTVWEQVIRPTLMDTEGGGLLISTPRGRNWFYKRWRDGQQDDKPSWKSWTFTSYDNPHLPPTEVAEMKDELPALIFAQEALAQFIADGSSVFQWPDEAEQPDLVLDNHLIEDSAPKGQVFMGVDLAKTTDYTVLYAANENDMRNVYYERFKDLRWKEQKRRIRRAVRSLERAGAETVTMVMDSTGVGDPIVEDMEDDGYDVIGINFTNTKNKMVTKLAKDLETGRAMILGNNIDEFEDYQMSTTKAGRMVYSAPEGDHDDVVSAKMLQHWGITTEGSPNVVALGGAEPQEPQDREVDPDDEFADEDRNDWSDLLDDDEDMSIEELVARPGRFSGVGPRSPRVAEPPVQAAQPTPEDIFANPEAWT